MNPVQRKIFAILYAQENGRLSNAKEGAQLIAQMRSIGLQANLDSSATDDSFAADTDLVIPKLTLQNSDILETALRPYNATLALVGNRLSIVSLDVANDPKYFTHLVYDVSHLVGDSESFIYEIKGSIDPEGWDDTNGDGVLTIREFNGQKLMTLAQTLNVHLQIQEYMRGLTRLHSGRKFRRAMAPLTGSRIVSPAQTQTERSSPYRRHHGIGSYGMSGGVF